MSKYRKVDTRIWNDAWFCALSERGQLSFLFLMTHPNMTMLGAMRGTVPGLASEIARGREGLAEGYAEAFQEVFRQGKATHDPRAAFIWLPNFLKYNPPDNPNVVKSWGKALDLLPECNMKHQLIQHVKGFVEGLTKGFQEALPEGFKEQYAKTGAGAGTGAGTEREQEKLSLSHSLKLSNSLQERDRDIYIKLPTAPVPASINAPAPALMGQNPEVLSLSQPDPAQEPAEPWGPAHPDWPDALARTHSAEPSSSILTDSEWETLRELPSDGSQTHDSSASPRVANSQESSADQNREDSTPENRAERPLPAFQGTGGANESQESQAQPARPGLPASQELPSSTYSHVDERETWVIRILNAGPKPKLDFRTRGIVIDLIEREADMQHISEHEACAYLEERHAAYKRKTDAWPASERRWINHADTFFGNGMYRWNEIDWERGPQDERVSDKRPAGERAADAVQRAIQESRQARRDSGSNGEAASALRPSRTDADAHLRGSAGRHAGVALGPRIHAR